MNFFKRLLVFLLFAWRSTCYALTFKPDLVFATSTPLTIGIPAVLVSKLRRAPLVFEVRDLWPEIPIALNVLRNRFQIRLARWLERWIYTNSRHVIALSPGMADGVKRVADVPVTVVPNAADLALFDGPGEQQLDEEKYSKLVGSDFVVYTGTLGYVNNIEYLVQLACVLKGRGELLKIAVFGSGREAHELKKIAAESGVLDDNFLMFEPVPKSFLPVLLSKSKMAISTVLPIRELWDNSANKFFDALAAGRPIIINHYGWQADIIEKYGVGVVMDPHSPENGAAALMNRLKDEVWLEEAGRRSRQVALDCFERDLLFQRFLEVLESVHGADAEVPAPGYDHD